MTIKGGLTELLISTYFFKLLIKLCKIYFYNSFFNVLNTLK